MYASLRDPVSDQKVREFDRKAQSALVATRYDPAAVEERAAELVRRADEHGRGAAARYANDLSAINEFAENAGIVPIPGVPPAVAFGRNVRGLAGPIVYWIIGLLAVVVVVLVLTGQRSLSPFMIFSALSTIVGAIGMRCVGMGRDSGSAMERKLVARRALFETVAPPAGLGAASTVAASGDEPDQDVVASDHASEHERKIAGIRCAIMQLDKEWLDYQLILYDWWLGKPALRDDTAPATAMYRSAYDQLTQMAAELSESSSDEQIAAADQAAERALLAWQAANACAEAAGVSDRTPSERAALRHLNTLVAELADPGTVRERWSVLVAHISREMDKLTTIPASWAQVRAYLDSLGIGERLPAIEA